ncbi:MAG: DNA polymerase III subunit delta [Lachnospiraceae bacterium]|nr:DNA polymerase III subunit delta [Lachnospiraceae bacterium]
MKNIKEHIKNKEFKRVYLLYGTEEYLKRLYRNKLKEAVLENSDSMNLAEYAGKGIDEKEVRSFADTMPFFADYHLLILENTGWFKSAADFADYIPEIPDTAVLVFVETDVDKRGRMYKAVKEHGYICEMNGMTEQELKLWVASLLKRENRKITENTVQFLLEQVGTDMSRLQNELEKLICYTMGRDTITTEDIKAVCSEQLTGKIFVMTEAMANGRRKQALELYYDLLALQEKPMGILYLIQRQFHFLLIVKEMKKAGTDKSSVASALGVPPFAAQKYLSQADRFQTEALQRLLDYSLTLEEDVKTGRLKEQLAVELLLGQ